MDLGSLVSIIIAVKNGERFLAEAINSVLAQDYRPIEIIVVDGHSVDGTAQIARSFAQVRLITQKGRGVSDAYNTGIDAARGEIITFLSHDDIWLPEKLSLQVTYLLEHPDSLYCSSRVKYFLEPGFAVPLGFRHELLDGEHVAHIMETVAVRRWLFDRIGVFDTNLSTAEDIDWFARAVDMGYEPVAIPKVLVYKRVHDSNISLGTENGSNILTALKKSLDRKKISHTQ